MKKVFALLLVILPGVAWGQGAIRQNGPVTIGDIGVFSADRVLETGTKYANDTGKGVNPITIYDKLGLGLCSNSAPITGTYHSLCIGHDSNGSPIFSVDGSTYPFLGLGSGNVIGPGSSAAGHVALFNNTGGTLIKDSVVENGGGALAVMSTSDGFMLNSAVNNAGTTTNSWLKDAAVALGIFAYLPNNAALINTTRKGEMAIVGASRTSDNGANCCTMGLGGVVVNDATAARSQSAWPGYFSSVRNAGAGNTGIEIDVNNLGNTPVSVNPYMTLGGANGFGDLGVTAGAFIQAGGETAHQTGQSTASTGLFIGGNGSTFDKGIVFQLLGLSGPSPIVMEVGQSARILQVFDTSEVAASFVQFNVGDSAHSIGLVFSNFGAFFQNAAGTTIYGGFEYAANAVNRLDIIGSATGSPVKIASLGTDANIDVTIQPTGTGTVNVPSMLVTSTTISLPGAVTGTPVASLCLDGTGKIIKKTTAGSCI